MSRAEEQVKITVSLPAEIVERLDAHAEADRRSRSNALLVILESALAETKKAS